MPQPMNNLAIKRIAIHQIFERTEDKQMKDPRYNNVLTQLSNEGTNTLCQRVTDALGNNSHSIDMDIVRTEINSTFQVMAQMLYKDNDSFLGLSKEVAKKLAQSQSKRNIPGGIIVIFDGTVGPRNLRYIATIKAESQAGFALESSDINVIILKYISELLLTPQQKLYKIGMFVEKVSNSNIESMRSADEFDAIIYDQNMNNAETRNAALYFYETFLGCTIKISSKKYTQNFYIETREFINKLDISDEDKFDYHNSLYDYLKMSRETTVSINDFSNRYFEPEIIDRYNEHMRSKNFPANAIMKDIEYIKNKLRRRQIKFTSQVRISAPSENFENLVQIVPQENNTVTTMLRIQGKIEEQ